MLGFSPLSSAPISDINANSNTISGNLNKISSSFSALQASGASVSISLAKLTSSAQATQTTRVTITANLYRLSPILIATTMRGDIKKVSGSVAFNQSDPHVYLTGNLRRLSGNTNLIANANAPFFIAGQLKKIGLVITAADINQSVWGSVSGNLNKITGSINLQRNSQAIVLNGLLRPLSGTIYALSAAQISGNLRKISGSFAAFVTRSATITANLKNISASINVDRAKTLTLAGNLKPITSSFTVGQNPFTLAANLRKLTSSVIVSQDHTFSAQLNKLSGEIDVTMTSPLTISGQLAKVTALFNQIPIWLNGQLQPLTSLISQPYLAQAAGQLNPLSGQIGLYNSTINTTISGQISSLTGSQTIDQKTVAVLTGQLNKLISVIPGAIPKVSGVINAVRIEVGTLSADLPQLTSSISEQLGQPVSLVGNISSLSGSITTQMQKPFALVGSLRKLTSQISLNKTTNFRLNAFLSMSGRMTVEQNVAPILIRPQNIFKRKLNVQNPWSIEPTFGYVLVNGVNILTSLDGTIDNYDDPSVDEFLHGLTKMSFLCDVTNNQIFNGTTAISFGASSSLSDPTVKMEILPTIQSLPPGLFFDTISNGFAQITGTVKGIPDSARQYGFLVRVTNAANIHIDRYFYFTVPQTQDLEWLQPLITNLGDMKVTNHVNIPLQISNKLNLPLTYTVNPPLPSGLQIVNGSIVGVIDSSFPLGAYSFAITVNDGVSPTISATFTINVVSSVGSFAINTGTITWITKNTSLGSTYTMLPSHFAVKAVEANNRAITYSLAPSSNPLPFPLQLNAVSGQIQGLAPFQAADQTYKIVVRAQVDRFYVDKEFTFTVLRQFTANTVISASLPMEEPALFIDELGIWNLSAVPDSLVFRSEQDIYFGRVLQPKLSLGARSTAVARTLLPNKLQDMQASLDPYLNQSVTVIDHASNTLLSLKAQTGHLPISGNLNKIVGNISTGHVEYVPKVQLTLGQVNFAPAYSPDGSYVYDVVYIDVVDLQANTGGFDNDIETPVIDSKIKSSPRVYPSSLNNIRQAWIQSTGQAESNLVGLPLWQRGKAGSGWKPAIEILYVEAGQGSRIVDRLTSSGFVKAIKGKEWSCGRIVFDSPIISGAVMATNKLGSFVLGVSRLGSDDTTAQHSLGTFVLGIDRMG